VHSEGCISHIREEAAYVKNQHEAEKPLRHQANGLFAENDVYDKYKVNEVVVIEVERLSEEIKVVHENGATHQQGEDTQHAFKPDSKTCVG
jgi:hypothetical protein